MNRTHAMIFAALVGMSCKSSNTPAVQTPPVTDGNAHTTNTTATTETPAAPAVRMDPPASGPARDVHLPTIRRRRLANGLELNAVEYHTLPVVHIRLAIRAGSAHDPANLPGLASLTGDMLKEGTRARTSAQIAEAIEFVGGSLDVITGPDATTLSVSVLKDHADTALSLLAEVLSTPTFPQSELDKLKRRETDRLQRSQNDPGWLSQRAFAQAVYGPTHPYGRFDTTPEVLGRITRADVLNFHRARYVGSNMTLVVVGDLDGRRSSTPSSTAPSAACAAEPRPRSPSPRRPRRPRDRWCSCIAPTRRRA